MRTTFARWVLSIVTGLMAMIVGLMAAACGSGSTDIDSAPERDADVMAADETVPAITTTVPQPVEGGVYFYDEFGDDDRFAELTLPANTTTASEPMPVVVLIHGGFWQSNFGLDLMYPLVDSLTDRGFAVWNIEYHRVGQTGGGYPGTFSDVAAAIDHLEVVAAQVQLDLADVTMVGHSAGGHLALWAGSRSTLPDDGIGANPLVEPTLVVGQAAVTDLIVAAEAAVGRFAVQSFMGAEPHQDEEAYRIAQPRVGQTATVLVHGDLDFVVPLDQSTRHADAVSVEVVVIEGDDHFAAIDPESASWAAVLDALETRVAPRG